jgi:hypothetical protein
MTRGQMQREEAVEQAPVPALPLRGSVGATPQVRLIAGADVQDMDLAGHTVGDARAVALAVFGIDLDAQALIDGQAAGEHIVLRAGQQLEFTKRAGQKGANGSVIEMAGDRATWRQGGRRVGDIAVRDLLERIEGAGQERTSWRLHPPHVRLFVPRNRGRTTGVVVEMPPGPRRVRWIADRSPEPFGPGAQYDDRYLSFPWVVLLLVFDEGELTGFQQAFFRTTAIGSLDDALYFTNLLNVARGYDQESWVCLVNLESRLGDLSWPERIAAVTEHFWHAAFNRSAEVHEANSYWRSMRGLDPRLATAAEWEAATRDEPYFTLGVPWKRAPDDVGQTLERMLEMVCPCRPIERVEHLVTLIQQEDE